MLNQTSIDDFFLRSSLKKVPNDSIITKKNFNITRYFSSNDSVEPIKKCVNNKKISIKKCNDTKTIVNNCDLFYKNDIQIFEIFTDGSTINNGKKNSSGGIGVFSYDDDTLNLSEKYKHDNATNQKCEILAIFRGLQVLKTKFGRHINKMNVVIHTDSDYCIKCMTKYIKSWIKNNWKLRDGGNVKNRNLLELLFNLSNEFNNIRYNHIRSHQIEPSNKQSVEYKLWYGNMMADKLASDGRKKGYFK